MSPQRIHRKRTRGATLPAHTKCVTRPGPFGNPFYVAVSPEKGNAEDPFWCTTQEDAVGKFEALVIRDTRLRELIRTELRGFNLACYCKPGTPCHVDVLLRIANE